MVLINSRRRASPSATILSGVSATAKSFGVALFTPAAVAWAESPTAISSVNGSWWASSPFGTGLAAWNRRNASAISPGVQSVNAAGLGDGDGRRRPAFAGAALELDGRRFGCRLKAPRGIVLRAMIPV